MQGLDRVLHTKRKEIVTKFLKYFKLRWVRDPTIAGACALVRSTIKEKISIEDNEELCRLVTIDEIETIFRSMSASKVPGPDEFSGYFYNQY